MRVLSAIAATPRAAAPCCGLQIERVQPRCGLQIELVQLLQDAIHLGQHFLALVFERQEFLALPLHDSQLGLQAIALLSQEGDGLRRTLHGLLELGHALGSILRRTGRSSPPFRLTSAPTRFTRSRTVPPWSSLTSLSLRVRSGAWNVKLHARLRRPGPIWSPVYTSNSATRVRSPRRMARIAAS